MISKMYLTSLMQRTKINFGLFPMVLLLIVTLSHAESANGKIHIASREKHKITFEQWEKYDEKNDIRDFHRNYLRSMPGEVLKLYQKMIRQKTKRRPTPKEMADRQKVMGNQIKVIGIAVKKKPLAGPIKLNWHHEVYTLMFWPEQNLYLRTEYDWGATRDGGVVAIANSDDETRITIQDIRIASKRHWLNKPTEGESDDAVEKVYFAMIDRENMMTLAEFHDNLWIRKNNAYPKRYHFILNNCWDFSGHVCRLFKLNKGDCKERMQHKFQKWERSYRYTSEAQWKTDKTPPEGTNLDGRKEIPLAVPDTIVYWKEPKQQGKFTRNKLCQGKIIKTNNSIVHIECKGPNSTFIVKLENHEISEDYRKAKIVMSRFEKGNTVKVIIEDGKTFEVKEAEVLESEPFSTNTEGIPIYKVKVGGWNVTYIEATKMQRIK